MASVKENLKDGKIFSYKFTACLGRDQRGKQIRKYKTWYPPTGLSKTRLRKLAQKEADKWEDQLFANLNNALQSAEPTRAKDAKNDFVQFAMNWFNTQVVNSSRKPKTIDCYEGILRTLTPYFKGYKLEDIAPSDIDTYLTYLQTKHKGRFNKPLSPKTAHHHYCTFNLIFSYAEDCELVKTNPMKKVKAPRKYRKKVDALTQEQTKQFLHAINGEPLEQRCMLLVLLTTGVRRGECAGLQWKDIDHKD